MATTPKRPTGLLWIVWLKGILATFAVILGLAMLATGELNIQHLLIRLGFDQIKGDATGLFINIAAPYVPVIRDDAVRNLALGFIIFGVIKLFLIIELWRLEEWARKVAIGFFILLLPIELTQVFGDFTFSHLFSVVLNALIIWYLWRILPREVVYLERLSRRAKKAALSASGAE